MILVRCLVRLSLVLYFLSCGFLIFSDPGDYFYEKIFNPINEIDFISTVSNAVYFSECDNFNCDFYFLIFKFSLLTFIGIFVFLSVLGVFRLVFDRSKSDFSAYEKLYAEVGYFGFFEFRSFSKKTILDPPELELRDSLAGLARRGSVWVSFLFDILLVVAAIAILTPVNGEGFFDKILSIIFSWLIVSFSLGKVYEVILLVFSFFLVFFKVNTLEV